MSDGEQLFARYAFAPNDLGYCGPLEASVLFDLAVGGSAVDGGRPAADVRPIAREFSGAWPYLVLLAELAGIDDPLDARVVRAYWTGSPLLDDVDRHAFGLRLIDYLGDRAGQYWRHLSPELLVEATATHGFHVFGVYPWSRLLGAQSDQPLNVLDNCRIRPGQVIALDGDHLIARSRRLAWDGGRLSLDPPSDDPVRWRIDGRGPVSDPEPGEWLALHWNWAADRLSIDDRGELERRTDWQLEATNQRLARERAGVA